MLLIVPVASISVWVILPGASDSEVRCQLVNPLILGLNVELVCAPAQWIGGGARLLPLSLVAPPLSSPNHPAPASPVSRHRLAGRIREDKGGGVTPG